MFLYLLHIILAECFTPPATYAILEIHAFKFQEALMKR